MKWPRSPVRPCFQPARPALADAAPALAEELAKLDGDYAEARELFEQVALGDEFVEFLTLPAYERID